MPKMRQKPSKSRLRARRPASRSQGRTTRGRPAKRRRSGVVGALANFGVFCLTVLIALTTALAFYARDLPDTNKLWKTQDARRMTLVGFDGAPIAVHGAGAGAPVRIAELPPHVIDAVLAVEDRNFYHHLGFNPISIVRAFAVNARDGAVKQGGSTITQQLAKNVFLNSDRTLKRKIQELLLALWLEQHFTKDEILTLYLNRVYFGAGAYGIDAASYRYFDKPAARLTVGEAAVLAGLLKAPSRLSPSANPQNAGRRARLVLDKMVEMGALTPQEAAHWVATPVSLRGSAFDTAPYFVDFVIRRAEALTADIDADLVVRTTFDARMQAAAELGMTAGLAKNRKLPPEAQAAMVILDQDGAIRAMIGGRDYGESQFNRASHARRQPGSAFKPFIYLAAVKGGLMADDVVLDAPVTVNGWSPKNYKNKYYGAVTMREALALSLNSAAVRLQEAVGRRNVRAAAKAMGIPTPLNLGPALALGVDEVTPLELAGGYAGFANGGLRVAPHAILSIETADGVVVYRAPGSVVDRAAEPAVIDEVNHMLNAVTEWGTGKSAKMPAYPVFGKTGTSQRNRDAWFAGHANGLTGVVWIGRDDNAPMPDVTGGAAAGVWRDIMVRVVGAPQSYLAPLLAPSDRGKPTSVEPVALSN